MKRVFILLVSLLAMMAASTSLKAQEVAIELVPGWNWIAYPYAETVDLNTALGSFTPAVGDMVKSQFGNSTYSYGRWRGAVQSLNAGEGYHYFSNRTEPVILVFGLPSIPIGTLTVTTSEPTNITSTTAACGGSAVSNDGTTILMKGVCWATHPQPTTNDSYTEDGSGPGAFTAEMTELAAETEYYVRAYAVSVKGINYGEELSFTTAPQGILNGLFSVSENNQVCFSQGNLQYQASTNTWRFAENQWDFVGDESHGNVYEDDEKCNNNLVSSTYNGWIDLFGWGTSDHEHGANCYQPWSANTSVEDYYAYGVETNSLFDQNGQADWGCNSISNGGNVGNSWRTLTSREWIYLFNTRNTASGIRWTQGNVNGVNGVIVLPDDWDVSNYSLNDANGGNFDSNTISEEDWTNLFEANGAVFLPAALQREGTTVSSESDSNYGVYWSSSKCNNENAYAVHLYYGGINPWDNWLRYIGRSVRLVRPAQANTSYSIEAVPNSTGGGTISGAGTYDYYAQVTLTATANEGYTFYQWKENGNVVSSENPYSFVALFDRSLEAVFLESSTYPLLYSYNEGDHTATVIGHWDGVELTGELVIPETVMHNGESYTVTTIGDYAFSNCSGLTSVVIPNTVTHFNVYAFSECTGLTSIDVPNSVTTIGHMAFYGCFGLTSVSLGNSVSSIEWQAFWKCENITSIEFPNSLTSIGWGAFRECRGLTEIVIPSSVTIIEDNPFPQCSNLAQITVESGNIYYDSRDNCNAIIETATNKLVSGSLSTVIPNTVASIGRDAFNELQFSSITIPSSVNYIGDWGMCVTVSSMTVLAEVPPTLGYCAFCTVNKDIPVYVPCASIESYQIASGWREFTNFIAVGQCSGMVTVTASPEEYGTVTGGGYYENSATCTVTALPNDGYYFLCWKEDGQWVSSQATYSFLVYRDRNLTAVFTIGAENIINGDFEQGNVGFTSEYEYNYGFGQGQYYVDNNAHNYPGVGHGGTGNFMMIDGTTEPGVVVWSEQVSVEPNTYYTFSTWACTLYGPNALLQFSINGTPIGVLTSPLQTNTWKQFITTWYSGDSTTATITIVDLNTEGIGNDFGLDDISFREFDPSLGGGDDHAYVDLGLPSGTLWATCNMGAVTPEDYGDYFAWGETQPKVTYDWSTYQYCNGSNTTLTKYCNNSDYGYNGFTDNLTTLLPEDDAATANWGSDWRMPTKEEWQELYQNTTHTMMTQNGVNGLLFTSSNGNSLFLPAAGFRESGGLHYAGSDGRYWSNSLYTDGPDRAWIFGFYSGWYVVSNEGRYNGFTVRPVRSAQN